MKPVFQKALPLLNRIEEAGFEAYFVGGSVRDFLLDKEIADVDIATSATPEEMKRIFPKTLDVGIQHGTVVVIHNGTPYEVTTFRSEEEYLDYRRPSEVHFIRSLIEDLQRRDFTMNAIAMDKEGTLIDPFHGIQSIKQKVIKTVGNAADRFQEDALRMMRAVRFFSQLTFRIDSDTLHALESSAVLLEKIAVERKLSEFEKLLAGQNRNAALMVLAETGLFQYLPGLASYKDELIRCTHLNCIELNIEEMWGCLLYHFGLDLKKAEFFLKKWKLPIKKIKRILQLLQWLHHRRSNEWTPVSLYQAGKDTAVSTEKVFNVLHDEKTLLNCKKLIAAYDQLPIKERSSLEVTGHELMSWLKKEPGPWIKEILEKLEIEVINGRVENSRERIREWLLKCNQS